LRTVLDSDYCEIGGMLGRSWNLPETLISAMEQHCSELYPYPDYPTTVLVGYAVKLVSALQHGKPERPEISLQASVNLESAELDNIYGILQDKFFEIQELARSVFSV
jgi:HD-like signal output (HDOD) protein